MKVLEASVRFGIIDDHESEHPKGNAPSLKVSLDDKPENEDYEYRVYGTDQPDKYVLVGIPPDHPDWLRLYMWYDREDKKSNGFGGRVFTFNRPSGDTLKLKGPWGTNFGVVNKYNLPKEYQRPTVEASVRAETDKFPHMYKSGSYLRGQTLIDALEKASEDLPGSWNWVAVQQGNIWDPAPLKLQNHRPELPFFSPKYNLNRTEQGELADTQNAFIRG